MQHDHSFTVIDTFVAGIKESGSYRCPECTPERKKQNRLDLSVTVNPTETLYHCFHCDIAGKITTSKPKYKNVPPEPPAVAFISTPLNNSTQIIHNFFQARGVEVGGIEFNGRVITGTKYFPELKGSHDAIGFKYGDDDNIAIKWRPANPKQKAFTQDGAARTLYGLNDLEKDQDEIIIVEGEADVIALASIGITSWSVPNGAPPKMMRGKIDPQEDIKFSYVWTAWEEITSAKKIILATDNDKAGSILKHELGRRIGLERCWEVFFPDEIKDVTDLLKAKGSDAVKNLFTNAKQMPLKGVYTVESYDDQVDFLYKEGIVEGESTGIKSVDELFKVKEGMLYVVTGYPGCGKSEFIDEIMVNMAKNSGWKWAVASFENQPEYHIPKLVEKYTEKPFYEGISQRISIEESKQARGFLNEHFVFLEQKDGSMASIDDIISRIKLAIARCGVRGAVIDPYNYIDMSQYEAEHIGISVMLSEISAFARANGVAIFFVAHPQKLSPSPDGYLPVPKGSHISGSAAWWAKSDVGFTVHRNDPDVEIHCWKARYKWLGKQGVTKLKYNPVNGKYIDATTTMAQQWSDIDF